MKLTVENKSYTMPRSWDDITIKQLFQLQTMEGGDTLTLFKVLTGIPKKVLSQVTFDEAMEQAILELNFLNELPKFEVVTSFEHKGRKYTINPDITDMSFGMYSDALRLEKNAKDELERVTSIAATITLAEGQDDYSWTKTKDRAKDFESLPVTVAYGIANFFLTAQKLYSTDLKDFSRQSRTLKNYKRALKVSQHIGGTFSQFTTWLKNMKSSLRFTARENT